MGVSLIDRLNIRFSSTFMQIGYEPSDLPSLLIKTQILLTRFSNIASNTCCICSWNYKKTTNKMSSIFANNAYVKKNIKGKFIDW